MASSRAVQFIKNIKPINIPRASPAVEKSLRVIVIGGSIGGLSAAAALAKAGAKVKVFEGHQGKLGGGSGIGIDTTSIGILKGLGVDFDNIYAEEMVPMRMEKYLDRNGRYLFQRENLPLCSVYWQDLYNMLLSLVPEKSMLFDRELVDLDCDHKDGKVLATFQDGETIQGDLLVGGDGVLSRVHQKAFGRRQLRYSGYSTWRGTIGPEDIEPNVMDKFRDAFSDIGRCHYFELAKNCHSTFFELGGGFINWNIFLQRSEPYAEPGHVTTIPDDELMKKLKLDTKDVISPILAGLVTSTKNPYLHDIFDADPPNTFVNKGKNVVLVGDAAHPTTPHAQRGANMTIQDSYVLAKCLSTSGMDLNHALQYYDEVRVPEAARSVYLARHLGRVKNGLHNFGVDPANMDSEDFESSFKATGLSMAMLPDHPIFKPDTEVEGKESALPILSINHVARETDDVERLTRFYKEVLGFQPCERPRFEFGGSWLRIDPSCLLHIIERDPHSVLREGPFSALPGTAEKTAEAFIRRGHHLAFRVFSTNTVEENLQHRKIPYSVSTIPGCEIKQIFFFDPDGNGIEVGSYSSAQPALLGPDDPFA